MNRRKFLAFSAVAALWLTACGAQDSEQSGANSAASGANAPANAQNSGKILIAFFSRADENYGVGVIEKGNTEILAEMIAARTGGQLFHIETAKPYPAGYDECIEYVKGEQARGERPALKADIDISGFETIFVGFPTWWYELPPAVLTFAEGKNWAGKRVIPFNTHEGSGFSRTLDMLEKATGVKAETGLSMSGTTAQNKRDRAQKDVEKWLKKLGF